MMITDYPGAIVYPADPTNYYLPENRPGGQPNNPKGLVLHTPEEPADNNPYTPVFFADPNRDASTHYFASFTGDIYQMVPERCMAIANGVLGKPYPAWADPATSLNWQTLSIEIEGYAASIGATCVRGGPQWSALVRWVFDRCRAHSIPLDRAHVIGHYEVANNRSDPGTLNISAVVADAIALEGNPQDDIEGDDQMPYPWIRSGDPVPAYRTYILVGGVKRWVVSIEHEAALLSTGQIVAPVKLMALKLLKAIPCAAGTPEADAP